MTIQSDLSAMIVTPNDVVSAIYKKLQADATLQGSTYLNSTIAIDNWNPPINAPKYRIVMTAETITSDDDTRFYRFAVTVDVRLENINRSRVPDSIRFDLIEKKCRALIDGYGSISLTNIRFEDCLYRHTSKITQSASTPEESMQQIEFLIACRYIV